MRALDEGTLQITLESPTPYFLELLTNFVAFPVPKHAVEQLGNDWAKPGAIVGNGAYVVTEWIPNTQVVLVKNAAFYDAANVSIDKVIYYADENQEALVKRFRARELDYAANFPSAQIDWLREHLPAAVRISPHLGINYYADQRDAAAFRRRACPPGALHGGQPGSHYRSGPRDGRDSGVQLRAPRHEQLWGAVLSGLERHPVRAAPGRCGGSCSRQAGYGSDKPLELTIRYNTSENYKKVAIAIQAMWKQIDVHAELENSEVKVHYNMLEEGNFDVGRAGMTADYDDAQNFLFLFQSASW